MVCVEALRKVDWLCLFVVTSNESIIPPGSKTAARLPDAELGVPSTTVAQDILDTQKEIYLQIGSSAESAIRSMRPGGTKTALCSAAPKIYTRETKYCDTKRFVSAVLTG